MSNELIIVAFKGQNERVKQLLEEGADVNYTEESLFSDCTALAWAARNGHVAVVRTLLEFGANMEGRSRHPLFLAVLGGHRAVIELLVQRGASVNMKWQRDTPVMYLLVAFTMAKSTPSIYEGMNNASQAEFFQSAEFLCKQGLDNGSYTPLMRAAFVTKFPPLVELFCRDPKILNKNQDFGWSALIEGVKGGSLETVQMLLNYCHMSK